MISICIPIYNFDCTNLVKSLLKQAEFYGEAVEILVMDDASNKQIQEKHRRLIPLCRFFQLPENVGRSKIRNLLAEKAVHPYLLFIDGDSALIDSEFLSKYLEIVKSQAAYDVICGGSVYPKEPPERSKLLRWRYSVKRESKKNKQRERSPYQSFTTNNFLIKKSVFSGLTFDERIRNYGHEDTLLGFQLKQRKVFIRHFDNPVLNQNLDDNEQYLDKSCQGVRNLLLIDELLGHSAKFRQSVPLLNTYFFIKRFRLTPLLRLLQLSLIPIFRGSIHRGTVPLFIFDLYRLGRMLEIDEGLRVEVRG